MNIENRDWEQMLSGADRERMREQMREGIPEPLIGLQRSHDKWERIGSGCGRGFPLYSLIGSDKSHDLESAPASAPYPLPHPLPIRSRAM